MILMWTKKGVALLCIGFLLLFSGLVVKSYQIVVFSVFIFSFLTISSFSLRKPEINAARLLTDEKLFEDGETEIKLQMSGKGFLEIRDVLPKFVRIKHGTNRALFFLEKHKTYVLSYTVECPLRGMYPIGPINVRCDDTFSLFYNEKNINSVSEMVVFPKIENIKEVAVRSRTPRVMPGVIPVHMPGRGSEFYSMRDYVSGDPFKDINWKIYSRMRKMMVIQRIMETSSDITIILDAREASGVGSVLSNPLVYSARGVASLSSFFLRRRNNIKLVIYAADIKMVAPGYGERHLYKILNILAGTVSMGDMPLQGVVNTVLSRLTPKSPVILVSSLENDDSIKNAVKEITGRGFYLIILSPSPPDLSVLLKLERENLISMLRGYNACVLDWEPDVPLSQTLEMIPLRR
ncbi:MAG: DUF58 domain-containing protein [Candidatus Thermoplasmatota archaeon]|nr:DUF58 domain-containing protein [Candidatus Thermoplasmatota archaeon]